MTVYKKKTALEDREDVRTENSESKDSTDSTEKYTESRGKYSGET